VGRIERALISVSDKKGIVEFCRVLEELNIELVSTAARRLCYAITKSPSKTLPSLPAFPR
jgi:phosphoribosylaminoimidazolecarboxamide formyltransferase/IMP cyclohydrolase